MGLDLNRPGGWPLKGRELIGGPVRTKTRAGTLIRFILGLMQFTDRLPVATLSLPTPYAVGPVNAYVITAEPVTMIDAGVNTVDAENAMKLGFATNGIFMESVKRILVTHGHPDHYGLVPVIQELAGALAYMGKDEVDRISDTKNFWEVRRLLLEAGFPDDVLDGLAERERRAHRMQQAARDGWLPVNDGDVFEFRDFNLVALSLPGHTGGHVGYLEPESGTLFSGDTLVPYQRPDPLLEPILEPEGESPAQRRRSLKQYLESLDRLEKLHLKTVFPGHGPVITNPAETIAYMRDHYVRRLEVVGGCLNGEAKSAFQLATELYPSTNEYHQFLSASEVIAHLDVLVESGSARHEIGDDGVEYFTSA